MGRPARPWFRFYVEAFNDRKLRRLTPTQRWVWVAVLGAARESCVPGELYIAPGVPMTNGELAEFAGVKEREIAPALEAMESLGMVTVNGVVSVTNWSGRQYESDDVTKRVQAHRERSKEQDCNVPCNAPDTETDTETERESAPAPKRTRRKPGQSIVVPFVPTDAVLDFAAREYPTVDVHHVAGKMVDWALKGDEQAVDWQRALKVWIRRESERQAGGWR